MPHNVAITDNNANWLNWGNLVLAWVNKTQTLPPTVADLRTQTAGTNVQRHVPGLRSSSRAGHQPFARFAQVGDERDVAQQGARFGLRRAISCSPMRSETAPNSCRTAIDGLFGGGGSGRGG